MLPIQHIQRRIYFIRGQKVMLDSELAELYGVSTKRLNEQVKRNRKRFPRDLMFQLSPTEKAEVVAIWRYVHCGSWKVPSKLIIENHARG